MLLHKYLSNGSGHYGALHRTTLALKSFRLIKSGTQPEFVKTTGWMLNPGIPTENNGWTGSIKHPVVGFLAQAVDPFFLQPGPLLQQEILFNFVPHFGKRPCVCHLLF